MMFPGFTNSAGAGGWFMLDTTTYSDGQHTIAWVVTDDCNRTSGVGSRYFTIRNEVSTPALQTSPHTRAVGPATLEAMVIGRDGAATILRSDSSADRVIMLAHGERLEVQVPRGFDDAAQLVGQARRPLPVGATWDSGQHRFVWEPAAAFLGAFDLVFTRIAGSSERIHVRVIITE